VEIQRRKNIVFTNGTKIRFESKFTKGNPEDCWLWESTKIPAGYGNFWAEGKLRGAHRVSYGLYVGDFPEHMCVLHKCDNPSCVNPKHLVLGTALDNSKDKFFKERENHPKGEAAHNARLTQHKANRIREFYLVGESIPTLAKTFEVGIATIWRIIHNKTYKGREDITRKTYN
jgi:hypothetical protein